MTAIAIINTKEKLTTSTGNNKRCPDYDSDCIDVLDFKRCYDGFGHLPKAIGCCPMLNLL